MILVFGANGLLGSTLCKLYPKDTIGATREDCDISQPYELHKFIEQIHPDVIINCAGIVKSRVVPVSYRYRVNTAAPVIMADACDQLNIRLIQVSTDCVFDGVRGGYTETDAPNPTDHYGVTKLGGEVIRKPHLTVRSSFVGWPDPNGWGLIAWMMSKRGETIPGYVSVMWNGLSAVSLASYLGEVAYSFKVFGLRHVFGETLSKYDVLNVVNDVYHLGCRIIPMQEPTRNTTLRTLYSDMPHIPDTFNFYTQTRIMKELMSDASD